MDEGGDYHLPQRPRVISRNGALRYAPSNGHTPLAQSLLRRGSEAVHSFVSPLAQVFQPMVVDETIPEEPSDKPSLSPVSFGPASRRRLYSMQSGRSHQHPIAPASPVKSSPLRKFPTMPNPNPSLMIPQGQPSSRSLDETPGPSGGDPSRDAPSSGAAQSPPPELTITEAGGALELENWTDSQSSIWTKRLSDIEKRQERIEDLLSQIAKDIRKQ